MYMYLSCSVVMNEQPHERISLLEKPVDTNDSIKLYNKFNFLRFVIINATSLANNQKEPAISTKKYVHEIFMGFFFLSKKILVSLSFFLSK